VWNVRNECGAIQLEQIRLENHNNRQGTKGEVVESGRGDDKGRKVFVVGKP